MHRHKLSRVSRAQAWTLIFAATVQIVLSSDRIWQFRTHFAATVQISSNYPGSLRPARSRPAGGGGAADCSCASLSRLAFCHHSDLNKDARCSKKSKSSKHKPRHTEDPDQRSVCMYVPTSRYEGRGDCCLLVGASAVTYSLANWWHPSCNTTKIASRQDACRYVLSPHFFSNNLTTPQ